jgi:hypothetical protein
MRDLPQRRRDAEGGGSDENRIGTEVIDAPQRLRVII